MSTTRTEDTDSASSHSSDNAHDNPHQLGYLPSNIASDFTEDDLAQLAFLRSEETDVLIDDGHLDEGLRLDDPLGSCLEFRHAELVLRIMPSQFYPILLGNDPFWQIENLQLGRVQCDGLRAILNGVYDEGRLTNSLSMWQSREELNAYGIFEPRKVILDLVTATRAHLHFLSTPGVSGPSEPPREKAVSNIRSSSEIARDLLGTPQDITKLLPRHMRILHVEEVLRPDLASRFYKARADLRSELEKLPVSSLRKFMPKAHHRTRLVDVIDHLLRPRLTFHGTPRQNVPSIVRSGFRKPGTAIKNEMGERVTHYVHHGSTYGYGIYSSPDPEFALSYSGYNCQATGPDTYFGIKLIVCATLMGRTAEVNREDNWRDQDEPYPGSDAHVSNRELEYIVFKAARIVPVYVIHLDWGEENPWHIVPTNPDDWDISRSSRQARADKKADFTSAGDRQRQRDDVMARARKWFPYGFGPKTGSNFVVEAVGDISEDEEEYGNYQALRSLRDFGDSTTGERRGETNVDFWSWTKVGHEEDRGAGPSNTVDEYGEQVTALGFQPQVKGASAVGWDHIPLPSSMVGDRELEEANDDIGLTTLFKNS